MTIVAADAEFSGSVGVNNYLRIGPASGGASLSANGSSLLVNGVAQGSSIISYTEFTVTVNVNTTVEASAVTIVTAPALTANGIDAYRIEFFCPQLQPGTAASEALILSLWDGATDLGWIGVMLGGTGALFAPAACHRRLIPSAASHTYSVRGHNSQSGNSAVNVGAGGIGALMPGYLQISKVLA